MKIALLNDKLDAGGAEKVLVNLANMLHHKGIAVSVILFLNESVLDSTINPSIPVIYLRRKGRFDLKAMFMLKRKLKEFDIAHIHSRYNLLYYTVVKIVTNITKTKTVFHEHVPSFKISFIHKWCIQKSDAYVAVWKAMYDWAIKDLHIAPSKAHYLANIINPPNVQIKYAVEGYKIILVSNYRRAKNHFLAIDLLHELPDFYTLDFYGAINDIPYYKEVMQKIETLGLQNRIRIILNVSDIYSILGNYNLAIHTATYETGPLVLLEYMHSGLPFLTYNTGDVVTDIKDDLPELIMNTTNVSEWKIATLKLMENKEKRNNISSLMKEVMQRKFTEEQYWNKLSNIYQKTIN